MSEQQTQKLVKEAAEIRRRYAAETNAEHRAQLTARYYQIEAELKALKTSAATTLPQPQSMGASQKTISSKPVEASDPFGIRMGMRVDQLGVNIVDLGDGILGLRSVPKPHSYFDHYMVQSSPECKVMGVIAFKPLSPVNQFGSELRSQFQSMVLKLKRIYGEPSLVIDGLDDDSMWTAPEHWIIGLLENERKLSATWDERASIPRDMRAIRLYASADSEQEGKIVLRYESINYVFAVPEVCAEDDNVL